MGKLEESEWQNDTVCYLLRKERTTTLDRLKAAAAIYGICITTGTLAFALYGVLDLRTPFRVLFHDLVFYKFSWIPNALYMYAFGLIGFVGILGAIHKFAAPKKPNLDQNIRVRHAYIKRIQTLDNVLLALLLVGMTCQIAVGVAISAFSYKLMINPAEVERISAEGMIKAVSAYGDKHFLDLSQNLDRFQKANKCCGSVNATDWIEHNDMMAALNSVPPSCCKTTNDTLSTTCGNIRTEENIYTKGCAVLMRPWAENYLFVSFLISTTVIGTEIAVLTIAYTCLCCKWCSKKPSDQDVDLGIGSDETIDSASRTNKAHTRLKFTDTNQNEPGTSEA